MDKEAQIAAKRFKQIREDQGQTQAGFAKILGMKGSTVDIERGKTKIPGWVVAELMQGYQINPLWLFGRSEMKILDLTQKDVSPKVITIDSQNEDTILLVNQKAAAGYPHNVQDVEWVGNLPSFNIPLPAYRNATYRGFQVEGDSMLPNIRPNEWVLGKAVASINEASDSRIYIVVLQDSVLVKKLQKVPANPEKIRLVSLNPAYLPIDVPVQEVQELWQVNSKLTFGLEEPTDSSLLRSLQASMEELKGQLKQLKPD